MLTLDIEIEGKKTSLINLYGPNNDSEICEIIENVVNKSVVITGDFNLGPCSRKYPNICPKVCLGTIFMMVLGHVQGVISKLS